MSFYSLTKISLKHQRKTCTKILFYITLLPSKIEYKSTFYQDPKKRSQKIKNIIPVSTLITVSPAITYT